MQITRTIALFVSLGGSALSLAACAPPRTSAATQATPAAFDAAKSEAKAVEIADKVIAAVGGQAAWNAAKQLDFTQVVTVDGQEKLRVTHRWDRWNGRHRYEKNDPQTGQALMVAYDIFEGTTWGTVNGKQDVPRDTISLIKTEADKRLAPDAFNLFMPFKLKDPGVVLKFSEERRAEGATEADPMVSDVIRISFEKVGPTPGDVYYLVVNKSDGMPTQVEVVYEGKNDDQRVAYKFEDWQTIGGLKLSLKRQNVGYAAEVITYADVKVSPDVDETLYVQQVR